MKFRSVIYKLFIGIFLMAMDSACESTQNGYVSRPVRSLLHPEVDLLEVDAVAQHFNDTVSRLYLQINNEGLLYKRSDTSKAFFANVQIRYQIHPEGNSKKVISSDTFSIHNRSELEDVPRRLIQTNFFCHVPKGTFDLELEIADMNRHVRYKKPMVIRKENRFSRQNFLVYQRDSVSFKTSFEAGTEIVVEYTYPEVQQVFVECFFKELGPALPPFSTRDLLEEKWRPDSTYSIKLSNRQANFLMPEKGFYRLKANVEVEEGLTINTVETSFPGVSTSREMIQCTRYIMSREEYETCLNATDTKVAIDNFWLSIGGSQERSRELLKRYYNRVLEANRNYSSYMPGWKSDRGMIYVVMGLPSSIIKNTNSETWIYGNDANPNSLRFVFRKSKNSFNENDYIMERSAFYRDPYHAAVEYWRQGVVFNDGKR